MSRVEVSLDGRVFWITFARDGAAVRIYERKGERAKPYWHAAHHPCGAPGTLIARILETARAKLNSSRKVSL